MVYQVSDTDIQQAITIIKDVNDKVVDTTSHFRSLLDKVQNEEIKTAKGLSFLEVKYHMLLSYVINLTHVMYRKVAGKKIQGEESIDRLVEIRTVLEKMRPIDQKLKYQIDKLIKTANTGSLAVNDPLRFKPNPANLASKLSDEEPTDSEDEDKEKGVYKPPKLAAVHYEGDTTEKDRQEARIEKARKRALSSNIMKDLRMEHNDAPEEIWDSEDLLKIKEDKDAKERTLYEEDRFVRLPVVKKKMATAVEINTMSALKHLTKFDDITALTNEDSFGGLPNKKRKTSGKKGKSKGKKGSKKKKVPTATLR